MMDFTYGRYTFVTKKIVIDGKAVFHLSVRPPMTDEEYDAIKYRIERLGGHWRERFGGFIFLEDPMPLLVLPATWEPIIHSDYIQWRINRQFYPTPALVAERVVELCEISDNDIVLEPSAGKGALIKPLKRTSNILAVEIDGGLASGLKEMGYSVLNMSFEEAVAQDLINPVDRVVMNPPFSQQRDIKHIMMAYKLLKEGGILTAIMSENDLYYATPLTKEFNEFLFKTDAYIEEVPMRGFAESETSIDTVIVKIKKKGAAN